LASKDQSWTATVAHDFLAADSGGQRSWKLVSAAGEHLGHRRTFDEFLDVLAEPETFGRSHRVQIVAELEQRVG
jgi:hypothetical protein